MCGGQRSWSLGVSARRRRELSGSKVSRFGFNLDFLGIQLDAFGVDALLFLFVAILVYWVSLAGKVPPLLGFIFAGFAVANLNIFTAKPDETALADIGILCLIFEIGLELTLARIRRLAQYAFNLGIPALVITSAIFAAFTWPPGSGIGTQIMIFGGSDPELASIRTFVEACVVGVGLSLSSSAFVLDLLTERGEMGTRMGQAVLGILLIQDIAVVPLLALLPVVQSLQSGSLMDSPDQVMAIAFGGLQALGVLAIVTAVANFVARPALDATAKIFGAPSDALTASVLFIVLLTSLATKAAGFSDTLGAFLIGALLAESGEKEVIEDALKPFRGLLLALFFLVVGSTVDPGLLLAEWRSIAVLLTGLLVVKTAVFAILGTFVTELSWSEALRVGLLLSQGGEFAFVIFNLADELSILPDELNKLLIIVVTLSILATPLLDSIGMAVVEANFPGGGPGRSARSKLPERAPEGGPPEASGR